MKTKNVIIFCLTSFAFLQANVTIHTKADQTQSAQTQFDQTQLTQKTMQVVPSQTRSDQIPSEQTRSEQTKSDHISFNIAPQKTTAFPVIASPIKDISLVDHAKRLCNRGFHSVFSQDGGDFLDYWSTAREFNFDVEDAYTSLRLFFNNIKFCEVVDYTVVDQVVQHLPNLFCRYFDEKRAKRHQFACVQEGIEDLMLERFEIGSETFHTMPDVFITDLSKDVTGLVKSRMHVFRQEQEEWELREKFRNLVVRFLDSMINKAIWYRNDYHRIWESFVSIADGLHYIGIKGIINDQDNLDELWDSLVKRMVWYLDLEGHCLPLSFFEQIEEDLSNNAVAFLEVAEQDDGIMTKKELLQERVARVKARVIAYEQHGMITGHMT